MTGVLAIILGVFLRLGIPFIVMMLAGHWVQTRFMGNPA